MGRRCSGFAILALAPGSSIAKGETPLVANGSFESGQEAPAHWKLSGQGEWAKGAGQRGERFVRADSESGAGKWQSDELTLVPKTDYRLEGWVRSPHGEARLGLDLVDSDGHTVQSVLCAAS